MLFFGAAIRTGSSSSDQRDEKIIWLEYQKKNTVRAGTDDIEIQLPQFESKIIYERFFR